MKEASISLARYILFARDICWLDTKGIVRTDSHVSLVLSSVIELQNLIFCIGSADLKSEKFRLDRDKFGNLLSPLRTKASKYFVGHPPTR